MSRGVCWCVEPASGRTLRHTLLPAKLGRPACHFRTCSRLLSVSRVSHLSQLSSESISTPESQGVRTQLQPRAAMNFLSRRVPTPNLSQSISISRSTTQYYELRVQWRVEMCRSLELRAVDTGAMAGSNVESTSLTTKTNVKRPPLRRCANYYWNSAPPPRGDWSECECAPRMGAKDVRSRAKHWAVNHTQMRRNYLLEKVLCSCGILLLVSWLLSRAISCLVHHILRCLLAAFCT